MRLKFRKCFLTTALLIYFARDTSPAADQVLLQFNPAGLQGEVALRSNMGLPVSAMYPEFTIWRSTNLQTWQPLSGPISGHAGVSDEFLRVAVPLAGDRAFYRVVANIKLAPAGQRVGDAVYGYGTEFARQLQLTEEMALRTAELVRALPKFGQFVFEPTDSSDTAFTNSFTGIWTNRVQFLDNFASTMSMLQTISEKELARAPLATNEVVFIQSLVENQSASYSGVRTYTGWYPGLFYLTARGQRSVEQSGAFSSSDTWDALVTDVHTDPQEPLVSDPGSVLHEGVGNVHLLMIAVDCGPGDAAVYAGPVQSHYEFEPGPATRETDSQWKSGVGAGNLPAQPDWTRGYLVPGP